MFYLNLLENPEQPKSNFWVVLFAIAAFFTMAWLCSGCVTQKACSEKFPTKDSTYVHDSIICLRDTVYLEPESFILHDTISRACPDYHRTVTHGRTTAMIDIKAGQVSVECKEAELRKVIESQAHLIHVYQSKSAQVIREIVVKYPWWLTFCGWYFLVTIAFLLLLLLWNWLKSARL